MPARSSRSRSCWKSTGAGSPRQTPRTARASAWVSARSTPCGSAGARSRGSSTSCSPRHSMWGSAA